MIQLTREPLHVLESEQLRVVIHPQFGSKISSLFYKPREVELLSSEPCPSELESPYDQAFENGWLGGWDECLPSIAPCQHPDPAWRDVTIPDHGEVWSLPWTADDASPLHATAHIHGVRFPYEFRRTVSLIGSSVKLDYTLSNPSCFPMNFIWASHPLWLLDEDVELHLPPQRRFVIDWCSDAGLIDADRLIDWPNLPAGSSTLDLSRPSQLPNGLAIKLFTVQGGMDRLPWSLHNRELRLEFSCEGISPLYWGVWLNSSGWPASGTKSRHFAIEPTTARHDALDRAVEHHCAAVLGAGQTLQWSSRLMISDA